MYCGLSFLTFGLCAITGSQARLALSVAFWILLNYKASLTHHASHLMLRRMHCPYMPQCREGTLACHGSEACTLKEPFSNTTLRTDHLSLH